MHRAHHYRSPSDGQTVSPQKLEAAVASIFEAVPIPPAHAATIGRLLVDTDMRGVSSHGVLQVQGYVEGYTSGTNNPDPQIKVLQDGPGTAMISGDGGLGIIVGEQAMRLAITKAKQIGVAVVTTTYHGHIGSAGKYVRMALAEDMVGMCLSGRSTDPRPTSYAVDTNPAGSIQGSPPMAVGGPAAGGAADFHLDFATGGDGRNSFYTDDDFARRPELFFRSLGISQMCNILSGTLGGQMLPDFDRRKTKWCPGGQSAFFLVIDPSRFAGTEAVKNDVASLVTRVAGMAPFPGFDEAALPGGIEAAKEAKFREAGRLPLSKEAVQSLRESGKVVGVSIDHIFAGQEPARL